jgi:hypothetical protein
MKPMASVTSDDVTQGRDQAIEAALSKIALEA